LNGFFDWNQRLSVGRIEDEAEYVVGVVFAVRNVGIFHVLVAEGDFEVFPVVPGEGVVDGVLVVDVFVVVEAVEVFVVYVDSLARAALDVIIRPEGVGLAFVEVGMSGVAGGETVVVRVVVFVFETLVYVHGHGVRGIIVIIIVVLVA